MDHKIINTGLLSAKWSKQFPATQIYQPLEGEDEIVDSTKNYLYLLSPLLFGG